MPPARRILLFFLRLVLLYALLAIPWPGVRETYAAGYRAVANKLFGTFGRDGLVVFRPLEQGAEKMDTQIVIANRQTQRGHAAEHSARLTGYLPTAELVALILATPVPWVRRGLALLFGLLLMHALIALRILVALLAGFSGAHDAALFSLGPFWSAVLAAFYETTAVEISFTYVAPLVLWIAVTIRRRDVQNWLAPIAEATPPSPAATHHASPTPTRRRKGPRRR